MCYDFAESLSEFFSCPENLLETEMKGSELINLEEQSLKQSNVEAMAWLLLGLLIRSVFKIKSKSKSRMI